MLELIRRYSHSIIVKIFLIILALTFIFCFGISGVINKLIGKDYLVKIGHVKISPSMFKHEKAKKLNMLKSRRQDIDEKILTASVLRQVIWENIVNLAASDFGFIVSDSTLKEYIGGMSMFIDKQGRFDANLLRNLLYKIQIPEEMFLELSKKDIENILVRAPFKYVSIADEADLYTRANLEKRTLTVVELDPASFKINEKPSQKELEEFHRNNQTAFTVDEVRSFRILELHESTLEKGITISEEELKDAYECSPGKDEHSYEEMKAELKLNLRQEKLQSKINEITRQIEDTLMAGEKVEDVAQKFDLKILKAEKVNAKNQNANSKKVLEVSYGDDAALVAFSLDEGMDSSFSETLDNKKNRVFWLVHLDDITPKHVAEFAKVSDKVLNEWTKVQLHEKAINMANRLVAQTNNADDLAKVATKSGYVSSSTQPFDRQGALVDQNNKKFAHIISEIYADAFARNKTDASYKEIDGKIVVYQTKEIIFVKKIDPKDAEKYNENLAQETIDDLYQELVGYLSQKYDVTINQEMLKNVNENMSMHDFGDF